MKRHTAWVGSLILAALFALPAPGAAQKPSCKDCEWKKCLEGAVQQKKALQAEYNALAKKWEKFWTDTNGGRKPIYVLDLTKLNEAARRKALAELKNQFQAFEKDEERATSKVGPPAGCGLGGQSIEMETDSVQCSIDMVKARQAEQAIPCKEMYEIAFRHEAYHLEQCQVRKGNNKVPTKLLTPAGKAREEAAAYAREIAELEALLDSLESSADYESRTTVSLPAPVGRLVFESGGGFTYQVDKKGRIKGEGIQTFAVDTSGSGCTLSGYLTELKYKISGTRANGILKLKTTPLTTTYPSIRATCPPDGRGFSLPVPITSGEMQIEEKDGAQRTVDFGQLTGGVMQGKGTFTLNVCSEKR